MNSPCSFVLSVFFSANAPGWFYIISLSWLESGQRLRTPTRTERDVVPRVLALHRTERSPVDFVLDCVINMNVSNSCDLNDP